MSLDCEVCGSGADVTDACPHCGRAYCSVHRTPEAHDCEGTTAGSTDGWLLDLDGVDARTDSDDDRGSGPESIRTLFGPGIGLAVATLLLVAAALGAVAFVGPLGGDLDPGAVEDHIETRTNEERLAAGVGAAVHDDELAAVARAHSRDMRDRGFVNHTNPDGEGPTARVRDAGLDCYPGENIYQAPRGALASSERALADHVVRAWLESAGHRRTLLDEDYTRQGVGVAIGENAVYVTQVFC